MNILTIKAIIFLSVGFLNFLLALLIWFRGKTKATFHLGLAAFFSSIYVSSLGFAYIWVNFPNLCLFFQRLTWIGALALSSFVTFVYFFTEQIKYIKIKSLFLYLGGFLITFFAISTPWFISEAYLKDTLITIGKLGPLDLLGRIFILFCIIFGLLKLIKYYFKTTGFKKTQTRYFILGISIYAFTSIIGAGLIPIIFKSFWVDLSIEISSLFSFFWVGLTTYVIFKYRLMDIRIVLGKGAVYFLSFTTVIVLAFLIMFINRQLVQPLTYNTVLILGAFLSILFFQLLKFYEKIASQYFYHTFYNTKIVIAGLEEKLTQVLELETLSSLIINTLQNTFKLEKLAILVKKIEKEEYIIQDAVNFSKEELFPLTKNDFLLKYLEKNKKPIIREELTPLIEKEREKEKFKEIQEKLEKIEANLLLPLIFEQKLTAIIILGNKISSEAFFSQDIELLTTLSHSASIALKNASLYSEIKNRKEELEKFYRLTVGRELKMIELKEKIKELEEKLKAEKNGS